MKPAMPHIAEKLKWVGKSKAEQKRRKYNNNIGRDKHKDLTRKKDESS